MGAKEIQYEQLCQDVRNLETRLYVMLPAYLVILGASLRFALQHPDDPLKLVLVGFLFIVSHAFTSLFAKQSIHQRSLRETISDIEKSDSSFTEVVRTSARIGGMKTVPISTYRQWSPLWIYFQTSADWAIMLMLMSSAFGLMLYFVKTLIDQMCVPLDINVTVISLVVGIPLFIAYCLVLARKNLKGAGRTE